MRIAEMEKRLKSFGARYVEVERSPGYADLEAVFPHPDGEDEPSLMLCIRAVCPGLEDPVEPESEAELVEWGLYQLTNPMSVLAAAEQYLPEGKPSWSHVVNALFRGDEDSEEAA